MTECQGNTAENADTMSFLVGVASSTHESCDSYHKPTLPAEGPVEQMRCSTKYGGTTKTPEESVQHFHKISTRAGQSMCSCKRYSIARGISQCDIAEGLPSTDFCNISEAPAAAHLDRQVLAWPCNSILHCAIPGICHSSVAVRLHGLRCHQSN